tara:strand:+ start:5141 stop:5713 length:573 start_codon:yes stop_codon:yes gene_type:complete
MAAQGGGLADLGILGESFNWWIGQICDDSTWRDNILPYKFDEPEQIKGWGYRYKVRILGIHPMSNDTLPSEKLDFASVMYGVTDGGGQGGALATPAIRPGNMVFGFWANGVQENVPIIMGILGNNSQTQLQGKTELTGGKAGKGISGYSEQGGEKDPSTRITAGDNLCINKPTNKKTKQETGVLRKMGIG